MCRWKFWYKHGAVVLLHNHTRCEMHLHHVHSSVWRDYLQCYWGMSSLCTNVLHSSSSCRKTSYHVIFFRKCLQKTVSALTSTTSKILWNAALGQQQAAALTVHQNKHKHLIQDINTEQLLACLSYFMQDDINFCWRFMLYWETYSLHNSDVESWNKVLFYVPWGGRNCISAVYSLLPKEMISVYFLTMYTQYIQLGIQAS